jgi:hypothetical protein
MRRPWPLLAPLLFACSGRDFTPYREIDRLRVLAVRADKPYLSFTETTSITALVVNAAGDPTPIGYEWSWCPLTQGNDRGYACVFTREQIQMEIDAAVGPGVIAVPPFDLGTTATVAFSYALPPEFFQGICDAIRTRDAPEFVTLPPCNGRFPITVRLRATDGVEEVIAVKEVELIYDAAVASANQNPRIDRIVTALELVPSEESEIAADGSTLLNRDTHHFVRAKIGEEQAERYVADGADRRENLVLSWFIDAGAGDLERTRTSFLEGEIPFDQLLENEWKTPKAVDFAGPTVRMFFVLRDERRGVSWAKRTVALRE